MANSQTKSQTSNTKDNDIPSIKEFWAVFAVSGLIVLTLGLIGRYMTRQS